MFGYMNICIVQHRTLSQYHPAPQCPPIGYVSTYRKIGKLYICMGMHISVLKYVLGDRSRCGLDNDIFSYIKRPPWLKHPHQNQHRHHKMYHLARRDFQAPHIFEE